MRLALCIGTRPQFIKSALLVKEIKKHPEIEYYLIDSGQHYDYEMSQIFYDELKLSNYKNLNVGSGSACYQIGTMMIKLAKVLEKIKPDITIVVGDTNSTVAGALTSVKLDIPVAHVEAGVRCYDKSLPEEQNRILTDHCSSLLFPSTQNCLENLGKEGIETEKLAYLVGDVMYDLFVSSQSRIVQNNIVKKLGLNEPYGILTIHRPSNLELNRFTKIIETVENCDKLFIFPIHPRTKKFVVKNKLTKIFKNIVLSPSMSYYEMMKLLSESELIITDSGGLIKEAFWNSIPCITLRENVGWIETVQLGANHLIKNIDELVGKIEKLWGISYSQLLNPFGNGDASQKIVEQIIAFNKKLE